MLGPNDIEDWYDEDERLRAEIRLLPIVQRRRTEPKAVAAILGRALSARLRQFEQGANLGMDALAALHADLAQAGRPLR